jgi:hypothetical protein
VYIQCESKTELSRCSFKSHWHIRRFGTPPGALCARRSPKAREKERKRAAAAQNTRRGGVHGNLNCVILHHFFDSFCVCECLCMRGCWAIRAQEEVII